MSAGMRAYGEIVFFKKEEDANRDAVSMDPIEIKSHTETANNPQKSSGLALAV